MGYFVMEVGEIQLGFVCVLTWGFLETNLMNLMEQMLFQDLGDRR
jgi:hypothetical protein